MERRGIGTKMKVKDFIKILEEFNSEAEFKIVSNISNPIHWTIGTDITEDKKSVDIVYFRLEVFPQDIN